jgi:hypothetical protein
MRENRFASATTDVLATALRGRAARTGLHAPANRLMLVERALCAAALAVITSLVRKASAKRSQERSNSPCPHHSSRPHKSRSYGTPALICVRAARRDVDKLCMDIDVVAMVWKGEESARSRVLDVRCDRVDERSQCVALLRRRISYSQLAVAACCRAGAISKVPSLRLVTS